MQKEKNNLFDAAKVGLAIDSDATTTIKQHEGVDAEATSFCSDDISEVNLDNSYVNNNNFNIALPQNTVLQGSKYKIVRKLGQGGFGITYEGVQTGLGRKVAIKEFFMKDICSREGTTTVSYIRTDSMDFVIRSQQKFLKEARMIADLQHTNIIKIIDVFQENNTAYYVMEHISGGSLQDIIESNGPIPEKKALSLIRQLADALNVVHQHNILHLDVKPANVMMRDDNTPVLIDFGISKHYGDSGTQTTTSPVGISRGYAPMEQYLEGGVAEFSPATDIYSLGATLYYMLIGERPPEAQTVFNEGLPPLPERLSKSTREAIIASMRPKRVERLQSVSTFLSVVGGEQTIVIADEQVRRIIERLEKQGEYKEAYLRCMDYINKGVEVEFAEKKCEELIPLMQEKQNKSSIWLNIIGVFFIILLFIFSIIYIVNRT